MGALTWYVLCLLGRGQTYVPPLLLYAAAIVVLTTNDLGPLVGTYAACALTLFACLVWLTVAVVNAQSPTQRAVTTVAAGDDRRVLLADALAASVLCGLLSVVGLMYPVFSGEHEVTADAVAVGALAQVTCGVTGIACGLVCSRPVVPRAGYAVVLALALTGTVVVTALPPVGPVVRLLGRDEDPGRMLAPLAGYAGAAVALLAVGFVVTLTVTRRRS
jgi:hypothetical protein